MFDDDVQDEEEVSTESTNRGNSDVCKSVATDRCLLCEKDTGEHLQTISRGFDTFLKQCQDTGRSVLCSKLAVASNSVSKVHASCRRSLSYDARKVSKVDNAQLSRNKPTTRQSTGLCSFKTNCFLCTDPVAGSKDSRRVLSGQQFDDSIHSMIESRNFDDWAVAVKGRMESTIGDLFSCDAF
jgi:hypothetical protein